MGSFLDKPITEPHVFPGALPAPCALSVTPPAHFPLAAPNPPNCPPWPPLPAAAEGGNAVGNGLRAGMSSMQGWRVDMEVSGAGLPCQLGCLPERRAVCALPPFSPRGQCLLLRLPLLTPCPCLHPSPTSPMQDAHTVHVSVPGKPNYSFFAVFDGHGGALVARNSARDDGLLAKIMAQPQWKDIDLEGAAGLQALEAAIKGGFIVQDEVLRAVSCQQPRISLLPARIVCCVLCNLQRTLSSPRPPPPTPCPLSSHPHPPLPFPAPSGAGGAEQ